MHLFRTDEGSPGGVLHIWEHVWEKGPIGNFPRHEI